MRRKTKARQIGPMIKVIGAMVRSGVDWKQAASLMGSTRMPAVTMLYALMDTGNAHISDWRRDGDRQWRPVFSFGGGKEAPCPGKRRSRTRRKVPARVASTMAIVRALQEGSWHCQALAEHVGMKPVTVRAAVAAMSEEGLVYIDDWHSRGCGPKTALWAWGPGMKSISKPAPKCVNQIARERYRRARQADIMRRIAGVAA